MKNIKLGLLGSLLTIVALSSCLKEDVNESIGTSNPETSLYAVRSIFKQDEVALNAENLNQATYIKALVISNHESNNLPQNHIAVQNSWRNQIRGLLIQVNDASKYKFGDSVRIELQDAKLSRSNGSLILKGLNDANIAVYSRNEHVSPFPISIGKLKQNFEQFESTYVDITADVAPEPKKGETLKGKKEIMGGDSAKLVVYTEEKASFSDQALAPSASFRGVAFKQGDELQLRMQSYGDMAFPSGKLYGGWPESFEIAADLKPSYNMGAKNNVLFPSGEWNLYYSILGNTAGRDRIVTGKNGIRFQQNLKESALLQMNFDVPNGASKVTFWYGSYWTDRSSTFQLEYSVDQGKTWTKVGEAISDAHKTTDNMNAKQAVFLMNIDQPVRFRINKLGLGTSSDVISNGRLGVDDFAIFKSY